MNVAMSQSNRLSDHSYGNGVDPFLRAYKLAGNTPYPTIAVSYFKLETSSLTASSDLSYKYVYVQ